MWKLRYLPRMLALILYASALVSLPVYATATPSPITSAVPQHVDRRLQGDRLASSDVLTSDQRREMQRKLQVIKQQAEELKRKTTQRAREEARERKQAEQEAAQREKELRRTQQQAAKLAQREAAQRAKELRRAQQQQAAQQAKELRRAQQQAAKLAQREAAQQAKELRRAQQQAAKLAQREAAQRPMELRQAQQAANQQTQTVAADPSIRGRQQSVPANPQVQVLDRRSGKYDDNCVLFARSHVPNLPFGLETWQSKKNIINSQTPKVGSIAVISIPSGKYAQNGHLAIIEEISENSITIIEANYGGANIQRRISSGMSIQQAAESLNIVGYFGQ